MMKRLFTLVLIATFFELAPVAYQPVHAQTLFEKLFPRAAERRRERRLRRQRELRARQRKLQQRRLRLQRRNAQAVKPKVAKPKFYTYQPRALSRVKLTALSAPFAAALAKQAAERQALEQRPDWPPTWQSGEVVDIRTFVKASPAELDAGWRPDLPPVPTMQLINAGGMLSGLSLKARPAFGKAIVNHYKREPRFVWIADDGLATEAALDLEILFSQAGKEGLSPEDYALPARPDGTNLLDAARYEFALTARALRYFHDARHGVADPNRISAYHDFSKNVSKIDNMLSALLAAEDPARLLMSAHPRDKAYAALKRELAGFAVPEDEVEPVVIAPGTFLKPGWTSPEVANVVEAVRRKADAALLAKHAEVFSQDHSSGAYTQEVAALVRDMQSMSGLKPDGIVGRNTIRALVGKTDTAASKRRKVLLAIERLRWHPDRLGLDHVFINQPAYRVSLKRYGREQVSMNVVVGKTSNQTNFFHDTIEYVEFNPYWGIPRSILVNEMLPKLRSNPGYFDRLGYEVTNVRGRRISSSRVDWWSVGADFPFNVRQPPGPRNALGRLKIMFPNKHAIYMHDTPAKSLFTHARRAYSHGCVRLHDPVKMAAAVLGVSQSEVEREIAQGANKKRKLTRKLPVYVSYFTAWPNEAGEVSYYADIYSRDAHLAKAMKAQAAVRKAACYGA